MSGSEARNIQSSSIISVPGARSTSNGTTTTGVTFSTRQIIIIGSVSGAFAILLLLVIIYVWRRRTRKLENNRNTNVEQSAWMDSPHTSFWGVQSPFHSKDNNSTTSSIPSITPLHQSGHKHDYSITSSIPSMNPLRPVRRTLAEISYPPTSHYPSSSPNAFYLQRKLSADRTT